MSQTIFTYESIFADTFVQLVSHPLPEGISGSVSTLDFSDGARDAESLSVKPLLSVPGFSMVEFRIQVPFKAKLSSPAGDKSELDGHIPDIHVKVVIYTPLARQEALPDLKVDSRCQILVDPSIVGGLLQFAVNVNIVLRCSDKHQLNIPSLLSNKEHRDSPALQASWVEVCEKFADPQRTLFPEDFFPFPSGET